MSSNSITPQQIYSAFDEVERDIPTSLWEINGIKVWPLIRNYHMFWLLSQRVHDKNSQIVVSQSNTNRFWRVAKAFLYETLFSINDRKNNDKIRKTDALIVVTSSTRFFKVDGAWYNPYCDSITKHLNKAGIDSLVLEYAADGKYLMPRFSSSCYIQAKSFLITIAAKIFGRATVQPLSETLAGWNSFVDILEQRLGYDCTPSIDEMRFRVRQVIAYEKWFIDILKTEQPSVCLMSGYYSADNMGLIRACRKTGVLTIEIQHGVQGDQHFAYRKWGQLPSEGFDLLPQIFWTWGELEKRNIESWTIGFSESHRAIVGGNPCLHIYDHKGGCIEGYQKLPEDIPRGSRKSIKRNIVFTAQAFNMLPSFLIETMRVTSDCMWWMRIHPQYWETHTSIIKQCSAAGLSNINIDDASSMPLVSLMDICDVHVTEFSSCVLEAQSRGVFSIVINEHGPSLFAEFIAAGVVTFADNKDSLLKEIERQASKRVAFGSLQTSNECFFKPILNVIIETIGREG